MFFIGAILAFLTDQISKHFVVSSLLPGESASVVPNVLRWSYVQNTRGAFGLFGNQPFILIGMALVVLIVFWYAFRDIAARSLLVRFAFGLIVGGAIGNIIDRLHYRYVVDFIDFYRIWPNVFNVADSCITIGVGLLIISTLKRERQSAN